MEEGWVESGFLLLCSMTGSDQISNAPEDARGQQLNLIMSPEKTNLLNLSSSNSKNNTVICVLAAN